MSSSIGELDFRKLRCLSLQCLPLPLDGAPLWADPRVHRATRVASDLIERTVHGGSETGSWIVAGGSVPELGGQGWLAFGACGASGVAPREWPVSPIANGQNGLVGRHVVRSPAREGREHGPYRRSRLIMLIADLQTRRESHEPFLPVQTTFCHSRRRSALLGRGARIVA